MKEVRHRALAARPFAAQALCDAFLAQVDLAPGCTVAGYHPLPGELSPARLMAALHRRGHALALPCVVARGAALVFRGWAPGDPLVPASFGVKEPLPSAPEVTPDVLLVPLLAWDARGHRLGYGGGYYDRTLAALPGARAIGLSLPELELPDVPTEPWDVALERVITP